MMIQELVSPSYQSLRIALPFICCGYSPRIANMEFLLCLCFFISNCFTTSSPFQYASSLTEVLILNSYTLDTHALLPNQELPTEVREEMWDDGIHLTPYGYGVMGDHIANCLVTLWPTVKEPKNLHVASTELEQEG